MFFELFSSVDSFQFSVSSSEDPDFFGALSFLTVSGQLEAEAYACGMSRVYTFGPTFRADKSESPYAF